jgi:site-specific DNA-methyltransferase (adenine-specific)
MTGEDQTIGGCRLICGTAETVLPTLPDASVHLIIIDPPYYRVKTEAWDRQWPTREAYLRWLRGLAKEWRRTLTPNGSVYCFASPALAAHVEVMLGEVFHVIQRLTWQKPPFSTKAEMFDKETCRMFFPASEAILFAEQYGSDQPFQEALVTENHTYASACERLKRTLFGALIAEAMADTKTTAKDVTEAIGAYGTVNHGGAVSNWLQGYNIPSKEQYEAMRRFFNTRHGHADYLRREYEDLRREYEDLRREYEDLRRPFTLSADVPYTDILSYPTVQAYAGKHPAEKPLPLLRHLITVSSRPGDTVLDPCMGSGSTLVAAQQTGRQAIGIEQDPHWWQRAEQRVQQGELFTALPTQTRPTPSSPQQPRLL